MSTSARSAVSRESIPDDSQPEVEDVRTNVGQDHWDSAIDQFGRYVVYENASGEKKLLTEYTVPSLTGMIINELTNVKQLKSTLTSPTWTDLFKAARSSTSAAPARAQLADQILALFKRLRKSNTQDAAFAYKLMQDVLEKLYVTPLQISTREKRVSVMRQVVDHKDKIAVDREQARKKESRAQKEALEVEKSEVGRRKRGRDDDHDAEA